MSVTSYSSRLQGRTLIRPSHRYCCNRLIVVYAMIRINNIASINSLTCMYTQRRRIAVVDDSSFILPNKFIHLLRSHWDCTVGGSFGTGGEPTSHRTVVDGSVLFSVGLQPNQSEQTASYIGAILREGSSQHGRMNDSTRPLPYRYGPPPPWPNRHCLECLAVRP